MSLAPIQVTVLSVETMGTAVPVKTTSSEAAEGSTEAVSAWGASPTSAAAG